MEPKKTDNIVKQRKKKLLLFAPFVVLPLITLMLWSFGVIRQEKSRVVAEAKVGINTKLPGARIGKDSNWNKLRFYEQSDRDSARYRSLMKTDPYYKNNLASADNQPIRDSNTFSMRQYEGKALQRTYDPYPSGSSPGRDQNEEKVYRKLAQLNEALKAAETKSDTLTPSGKHIFPARNDSHSGLERLALDSIPRTSDDEQLRRMEGMLDKIIDIQHPDRIKTSVPLHEDSALLVTGSSEDRISLMGSHKAGSSGRSAEIDNTGIKKNGFFSLNDDEAVDLLGNAIHAVIPEIQTLVNGSTVKLRLSTEIHINGIVIPANVFIHGTATLSNERLMVHIASIRYKDNILPVSLSVYDLDGMAGIYIPGTITRDVAKQSTDQAIQSLSLATLDQSVGAQAATAGIEAAKTLISRKVKLIKVTVPGEYQVLLRDDNQKGK